MKKSLLLIVALMLVFVTVCFSACGENTNDNGTESVTAIADVALLSAPQLRIVSAKETPVLKYSFRDDGHYYYLFDLGKINNVPLEGFSNLVQFENHGQTVTRSFETSTVDTSTVTNTVTRTTQHSVEVKRTEGVKVAVEAGLSAQCKLSAEYSYSRSVGIGASSSYTNSYTNAATKSQSQTEKTEIKFDENAESGYYGYVLTGAVEVYAIVVYDVNQKEYVVDYFSDILTSWQGFYFFKTSDEFVNYEYETISFTVPTDLKKPKDYKDLEEEINMPIVCALNKYNCNDGNQYNKNEQEESADWRSRHDGFELVELVAYGCSKAGNVFSVKGKDEFSIKLHVLQNTEDLPRVGTALTSLCYDTETRVRNTNIDKQVGYGAYWVRITYSDDSQKQYNATDQLHNADSNTYIELVGKSNIDANKTIKSIEVVVAYELFAGAPGVLGIWWKEYTNWRCEYTFNFTH